MSDMAIFRQPFSWDTSNSMAFIDLSRSQTLFAIPNSGGWVITLRQQSGPCVIGLNMAGLLAPASGPIAPNFFDRQTSPMGR
jgi:hypothetical protein